MRMVRTMAAGRAAIACDFPPLQIAPAIAVSFQLRPANAVHQPPTRTPETAVAGWGNRGSRACPNFCVNGTDFN
jgi:hypothetical protein